MTKGIRKKLNRQSSKTKRLKQVVNKNQNKKEKSEMAKRKGFVFEIECEGVLSPYLKDVTIFANHLQGAVKQLYQNETRMTRLVRIIEG